MIKSCLNKNFSLKNLMSFITLFFYFISNALKSIISVSIFNESSLLLIDTCGITVIAHGARMRRGIFHLKRLIGAIGLSGINPLAAIISRLRRIQQLFKPPVICTKYLSDGMVAVSLFLWLHHVF